MRNSEKPYRIFDAPWDSDFFQVKAAKTVFNKRADICTADICTMELMAVEKQFIGKKIGSGQLRKLVEFCCNEKVSEIHVGTQIDNLSAIGYY
ncbi:MAG: hypothetical protein RR954_06980 [Christensenellaceae bacterium]